MNLQIDDPNPGRKGGELAQVDPGVRGFEVRDSEPPIVRISGGKNNVPI